MSFHESANDIELEDGHILKAKLSYGEDEERDAEMDLNDFIGNDNGQKQASYPSRAYRVNTFFQAVSVGVGRTLKKVPPILSFPSRGLEFLCYGPTCLMWRGRRSRPTLTWLSGFLMTMESLSLFNPGL